MTCGGCWVQFPVCPFFFLPFQPLSFLLVAPRRSGYGQAQVQAKRVASEILSILDNHASLSSDTSHDESATWRTIDKTLLVLSRETDTALMQAYDRFVLKLGQHLPTYSVAQSSVNDESGVLVHASKAKTCVQLVSVH